MWRLPIGLTVVSSDFKYGATYPPNRLAGIFCRRGESHDAALLHSLPIGTICQPRAPYDKAFELNKHLAGRPIFRESPRAAS